MLSQTHPKESNLHRSRKKNVVNKFNFTIYYFMKLFEKNLLLFRNKIETDIYVIIFNTIRYFIYIFDSTNLLCDNAPMILFTMMNTVAVFWGESSSNISFSSPLARSPNSGKTLSIKPMKWARTFLLAGISYMED